MKTLTAAMLAHLAGGSTSLVPCWKVTRKDGDVLRGTEHDRNITILGTSPLSGLEGTYLTAVGITGSNVRSNADLAVDNMEVRGARLETIATFTDLTSVDIEAGEYDDAAFTLFLVNWRAPNDGVIILRTGNIGEIRRNAEGEYVTELRGLAQKLSQTIIRTYGVLCDADLGDVRCGVNLAPLTITGTVTTVTDRRTFASSLTLGSPQATVGFYNGGMLEFTSGPNNGYGKEVKQDAAGSPLVLGGFTLWEPMPLDIEVGNTFTVRPGCNKSKSECKLKFDNVINFRGHGVFVPGMNELLKGPDRGLSEM